MKFTRNQLRVVASLMLVLVAVQLLCHNWSAAAVSFIGGGLVVEMLKPTRPGYLFAFTGVTLAEIFIPEVYATIQPNDSPETTAFSQSGVAVTNPLLQAVANSGAQKVEVPMWNDIDSSVAPNISDDTDTIATVGKVDTDSWEARNAYLNKGFGTADLAVEIAGNGQGGTSGDPMTRIKNRFGTYWARQFQYRIIAIARGIWAQNIAAGNSDMIHDISQQTTVGLSAANYITAEAIIETVFTMGDHFDQLGAIAMHSIPYKALVLNELIVYLKDSTGTLSIPTYLGKRVIVDDGLPVIAGTTSGFRYLSVMFGQGAIGYGEGSPKVPAELYRMPNAGNGGGLEQLWERKTWMIHPQGFNWTDASRAGKSASLAELRTAANWTRKVSRKQTQMAFLVTNG